MPPSQLYSPYQALDGAVSSGKKAAVFISSPAVHWQQRKNAEVSGVFQEWIHDISPTVWLMNNSCVQDLVAFVCCWYPEENNRLFPSKEVAQELLGIHLVAVFRHINCFTHLLLSFHASDKLLVVEKWVPLNCCDLLLIRVSWYQPLLGIYHLVTVGCPGQEEEGQTASQKHLK